MNEIRKVLDWYHRQLGTNWEIADGYVTLRHGSDEASLAAALHDLGTGEYTVRCLPPGETESSWRDSTIGFEVARGDGEAIKAITALLACPSSRTERIMRVLGVFASAPTDLALWPVADAFVEAMHRAIDREAKQYGFIKKHQDHEN